MSWTCPYLTQEGVSVTTFTPWHTQSLFWPRMQPHRRAFKLTAVYGFGSGKAHRPAPFLGASKSHVRPENKTTSWLKLLRARGMGSSTLLQITRVKDLKGPLLASTTCSLRKHRGLDERKPGERHTFSSSLTEQVSNIFKRWVLIYKEFRLSLSKLL